MDAPRALNDIRACPNAENRKENNYMVKALGRKLTHTIKLIKAAKRLILIM